MKYALLIALMLVNSFAYGGVSLRIQETISPSDIQRIYKVDCEIECIIEIQGKDGGKLRSPGPFYLKKIKELLVLQEPKLGVGKTQRIYSKIELGEGSKKSEIKLGFPRSYEGEEFDKYSGIISILDEVKRKMFLAIKAGRP